MAILLPDSSLFFKGIKIPAEEKRHIALLLYELASLDSFESIDKRLKTISDKRASVKKIEGMKEKEPKFEIEPLIQRLDNLRQAIQHQYEESILEKKIEMSITDWQPEGQQWVFDCFSKLLREKASKLISEAGIK